MPADPKDAVETLRKRIKTAKRGGSDRDRDLLIDFSNELKLRREDYGNHRHEKLLRHCTRISEHADTSLAATLKRELDESDDEEAFYAAKGAAETVVRWIHDTYDIDDGSQETNRDYRVAFRMFAKHITRGDEIPDTHEWISTKTSRNYDPAPDEADMLTLDDDVEPMLEACRNDRDAALIALQFEAGLRGGELYDLTPGDITDSEHSLKVRADGKRGQHDVHLIRAVPYVTKWLQQHPGTESDALWCKLSGPGHLSYQRFLDCFKDVAARAGVDKPVTPTNFRKSNAYWLAKQGESQAFIEDRQGRTRGSPVISRYVAMFSGETQEKHYAAMHGLDVEAEEESVEAPVPCPRCSELTPPSRGFCLHCNQALDLEMKELLDRVSDRLDQKAVEAEDPETRRDALTARRELSNNPSVMDKDDLHELVASLSSASSAD